MSSTSERPRTLIFAGGLAMPPEQWFLMPLRGKARERGWRTYYHRQGLRFGPIERSAERLVELVEKRHANGEIVVVVGHSMGGLVAERAATLGAPIDGIVTIGTPHQGTHLGHLVAWPVVRDMATGSDYLHKIASDPAPRPPILAMSAQRDLVVQSSGSRPVRKHSFHLLRGMGHVRALFEEAPAEAILDWADELADNL